MRTWRGFCHPTVKVRRQFADGRAMRMPALLLFTAVVLCSGQQHRSLPRDEAQAQRRTARPISTPRTTAARRAFQREHPCPANQKTAGACPGYIVDHIVPLACGGKDAPENMQWQTVDEAKRKDRTERAGCSGAR